MSAADIPDGYITSDMIKDKSIPASLLAPGVRLTPLLRSGSIPWSAVGSSFQWLSVTDSVKIGSTDVPTSFCRSNNTSRVYTVGPGISVTLTSDVFTGGGMLNINSSSASVSVTFPGPGGTGGAAMSSLGSDGTVYPPLLVNITANSTTTVTIHLTSGGSFIYGSGSATSSNHTYTANDSFVLLTVVSHSTDGVGDLVNFIRVL